MAYAAPSAHAHPGTPRDDEGGTLAATEVASEPRTGHPRSNFWVAILCTCAEIDRAVARLGQAGGGSAAGASAGGAGGDAGADAGAWYVSGGGASTTDIGVGAGGAAGDATGTAESLGEADSAALSELHVTVRGHLSRLREQLAYEPSCDHIILLLVLYIDERIMHRLSDAQRLRWPPLQREWLGASYGGDEFYRILDRALESAQTSSTIFEIFYYCLANGFVGRYAGRSDIIDTYLARLRERVRLPEREQRASEPTATPSGEDSTFRPLWYYLGTAVTVLAMAVLATALSGCAG